MGQTGRDLSTGQQVLGGSEWHLVSMGRVGAESSIVPGTKITLRFGNDGRVSGSGGCNNYGGSYRVEGDRITFSQLFSTRRACTNTDANRQEGSYLSALEVANRFRLSERRLTIYYDGGRSVLEFASDAPEEVGTTGGDDPLSALNSYYEAINSKDYRRAFQYWESPTQSYDQFVRGFSDTEKVQLLVDPGPRIEGAAGSAYASLATVVISRKARRGDRLFAGCYVLRKSNVQNDERQAPTTWHIYRATLSPLPSSAKISSLLSQLCRE
jgi:heat shock protein HslJ